MQVTYCPKGNKNMTVMLTAQDVESLKAGLEDVPIPNMTMSRFKDIVVLGDRHFKEDRPNAERNYEFPRMPEIDPDIDMEEWDD